ncbi:uncharacterized protein LY79DRAFT_173911 [Colletotrichum navitas]|uniref:Uncharacterized protein n=1 Tax=Colletotrichum navitas TaxID=681940 RepID=A0AAD8V5N8_9PEZI|nr:uncharacterized protein LY79DRAFT_173911 [Colletotrichum navitas]KAK1593568.1 hypothetical protein LY79DRAFT_173911 [Colletotrichum navitas]
MVDGPLSSPEHPPIETNCRWPRRALLHRRSYCLSAAATTTTTTTQICWLAPVPIKCDRGSRRRQRDAYNSRPLTSLNDLSSDLNGAPRIRPAIHLFPPYAESPQILRKLLLLSKVYGSLPSCIRRTSRAAYTVQASIPSGVGGLPFSIEALPGFDGVREIGGGSFLHLAVRLTWGTLPLAASMYAGAAEASTSCASQRNINL